MSIIEECTEFNSALWGYEGLPPTLNGSEWVFTIPPDGEYHNIRPKSLSLTRFGYGRYKFTIRSSGPKVSGVNICPFHFYNPGSGAYNELDIPEIYGNMTWDQLSISTYRNAITDANGNPLDNVNNKDYIYWSSSPVNLWNGAKHIWEWEWLPPPSLSENGTLKVWIDGALSLTWSSKFTSVAPMYLYMMVAGRNNSGAPWTLYLDRIEYIQQGTTPTPPLSYPTDRWQRLWFNASDVYLGETSEPNAQFNNDWAAGVLAFGLADGVKFSSSRTINIPTAGNYIFTLGSDDGSRLWIDDVLVIDNWLDQAYTTKSATVNLATGNHSFRIDYYENGGNARLSFSYTSSTSGIYHAADCQRTQLYASDWVAKETANVRAEIAYFTNQTGKSLRVKNTWGGNFRAGGGGTDLNWLLGSGPQGVLPLLQDGTFKELMFFWQMFDDSTGTMVSQVPSINSGAQDAYIRAQAQYCKAFPYTIYIRLSAEMNLHQQPGGDGENAPAFVSAWKRVVDTFRAQGVTNVLWVWNPNYAATWGAPNTTNSYYPGDTYVDWVGIDMYQWSDTAPDSEPASEISAIYNDYGYRKPIAICEWGTNSQDWSGNITPDATQASWMEKFFNVIESHPYVKMIVHFYLIRHQFADPIQGSLPGQLTNLPLTLAKYKARIANPLYVGNEAAPTQTTLEYISNSATANAIVNGLAIPPGSIMDLPIGSLITLQVPSQVDVNQMTLTLGVVGGGAIQAVPSKSSYALGEEVVLTAIPDAGWVFTSWGDGLTGSVNPSSVWMNEDKTVTATFAQQVPLLFDDDYATGTFSKWTSNYGGTIVPSPVASSPYAAKALIPTGQTYCYWEKWLSASYPDLFVQCKLLLPILPGGIFMNMIVWNPTFTNYMRVGLVNTSGTYRWAIEIDGAFYYSAAFTPQPNRFYKMLMRRKAGAVNGIAQLWVDDVLAVDKQSMTITGNSQVVNGGNSYADYDFTSIMDDFKVAETYIP